MHITVPTPIGNVVDLAFEAMVRRNKVLKSLFATKTKVGKVCDKRESWKSSF